MWLQIGLWGEARKPRGKRESCRLWGGKGGRRKKKDSGGSPTEKRTGRRMDDGRGKGRTPAGKATSRMKGERREKADPPFFLTGGEKKRERARASLQKEGGKDGSVFEEIL